jgi:CheY-like chemotaxis protein
MQIEDLQKKVSELRSPSAKSEDIVRLESTKTPLESTPRRILWVDDNPANNAYEIARLRNGGIEVIEATSTQDALDMLIQQNLAVCAVISDMGRRENGLWHPKAGVALTKQIREHNLSMPVFVYTSSEDLQQRQKDIISAGGNGATASTVELFEMINNIPGL